MLIHLHHNTSICIHAVRPNVGGEKVTNSLGRLDVEPSLGCLSTNNIWGMREGSLVG